MNGDEFHQLIPEVRTALRALKIATDALAAITDEKHVGCYGSECYCASTKVDQAKDALKEIAALTEAVTA